jgi:acyl transferase domain-containing protein
VLSAKTEAALREMKGRYVDYLTNSGNEDLKGVCATAAIGRHHLPWRLAVEADSVREAARKLKDPAVKGCLAAT